MFQAANSDSVEMLARRNCASILLAYEATALDKTSTAASGGGDRSYLSPYKCKDCGRGFVSFQALGGHRASHMKLRLPTSTIITHQLDAAVETIGIPGGAVVARPVRMKVHECKQCRDRFSTGQALGGHMRKHAELSAKRKRVDEDTESVLEGSEKKRKRVGLELDLNFPPPVDEPLLQLV